MWLFALRLDGLAAHPNQGARLLGAGQGAHPLHDAGHVSGLSREAEESVVWRESPGFPLAIRLGGQEQVR